MNKKYRRCDSVYIYRADNEPHASRCTLDKRHEEDHTDGERTWA